MGTFLRVALARIRGFLSPGGPERDFDEELRAHLEMAVDDKVRQGLSPKEARRQAHVELGNLSRLREEGRDSRGLPWLSSSWIDFKLALRMMRKSWGLTLVAGLAMAVVIGLAVVIFDVMATYTGTDLPLDEGERVVVLQGWDRESGQGLGTSPADFRRWRGALRSVEGIGAFRTTERNLQMTPGDSERPPEAVEVAEITASGFQVARVPTAFGRPLLPEDELPSAAPVLVIGHQVWRSRFAADPGVVGRRVSLDGTGHTIVGVMPEGFGFPVAHGYWTALRPSAASPGTAGGDELVVFARLRPGVTAEEAQSELRGIERLPTPEAAAAKDAVQLRVVPYVTAFIEEVPDAMVNVILLLVALLLIPPCLNVAILVYARTVTRQGEFAARYALGARRLDIVAQLFLEILVLAAGAGVVGLVVARLVLRELLEDMRRRGEAVPFWMDLGSTPKTVLFVAALAVLAALIAGVLPALRATGRRMQSGLRSLGGQTVAGLGGTWTALIVLQVAFSFALLPSSLEMTWGTLRSGLLGPGFAAEEYLTARLELGDAGQTAGLTDREDSASRFEARRAELVRALEARPELAAVSVMSEVPGDAAWARVEVEPNPSTGGGPGAGAASGEITGGRVTRVNHVDSKFFEVFELPVLAGRGFDDGDFGPGARAVVVNRSFVREVLSGDKALGQRIRYPESGPGAAARAPGPGPWFEIVGVVADLQRHKTVETIYHPAATGDRRRVTLALRVRPGGTGSLEGSASGAGAPGTSVAGTLRQVAWDIDPSLRLSEVRWLDAVYRQKAVGNYLGAAGLVAATLSVLLLSGAGIYAMMSFTVNRRRKEIGLRAALGAQPHRLVASIFGRALGQVGLGALGGILVALLIGHYIPIEKMGGWHIPGVIPAAAAFIVAIALLALWGPTRRSRRVQPFEELREG